MIRCTLEKVAHCCKLGKLKWHGYFAIVGPELVAQGLNKLHADMFTSVLGYGKVRHRKFV